MALIHWAADRGASEAFVALLDAGAQLDLQVLPRRLRRILATHEPHVRYVHCRTATARPRCITVSINSYSETRLVF